MIVLGLDACLGHCSVAVMRGEACLAECSEPMARGHIERLAPMVSDCLEEAGVSPSDIGLIGVTCGPGGFTGARLGTAFARGLALSTPARAVGISTLEALAARTDATRIMAVLDGRRGEVFAQVFADGNALCDPVAIRQDDIPDFIRTHRPRCLMGNGCMIVTEALERAGLDPIDDLHPAARIDPRAIARLAAQRGDSGVSPAPLYLRAPDAKAAAPAILHAP